MLAGVATRRHARIAEPVGKALAEASTSTGRSAVSRRFVKQTETALAELLARDLTGKQIKVLMLDGEHMAGRCVIVALAITAGGEKFPVGLWDGATENKTVVKAMLADLVSRGLSAEDGLLVVMDGREGPVGGCERGLRRPRSGAKMHPSLCRVAGYAELAARSSAGHGLCAEGLGIVRALQGRPAMRPAGDSGRAGCSGELSGRALVP